MRSCWCWFGCWRPGTTLTTAALASTSTTTISTTSATTATGTITPWAFATGALRRRGGDFALRENTTIHPAFDPDDTINGAGFGKTIVNGNAEGLQRNFTLFIPFSAGDVSTAQTTRSADTNAEGTKLHGGLHGTFHGPAEGDTALELGGDVFGYQLGFKFGLFDFENINLDLFASAHLADGGIHQFNF